MDGVRIRKFKVFPYGGYCQYRGRTHARMRLRSFGAMRCVVQVLILDTAPRLDLFRACPSGNLILSAGRGGGCGQTPACCAKCSESGWLWLCCGEDVRWFVTLHLSPVRLFARLLHTQTEVSC